MAALRYISDVTEVLIASLRPECVLSGSIPWGEKNLHSRIIEACNCDFEELRDLAEVVQHPKLYLLHCNTRLGRASAGKSSI